MLDHAFGGDLCKDTEAKKKVENYEIQKNRVQTVELGSAVETGALRRWDVKLGVR